MIDWTKVRHFTFQEFDDPDHPGSGRLISENIVLRLDELRERTGWPIVTHNKFGLRGCVCIDPVGHAPKSYHYKENGACAVDWHFVCDADIRQQAYAVLAAGFRGVGMYPAQWHWAGKLLSIGFHVDDRPRPQYWVKKDGGYVYLLP